MELVDIIISGLQSGFAALVIWLRQVPAVRLYPNTVCQFNLIKLVA
jgi:hypothetical protein